MATSAANAMLFSLILLAAVASGQFLDDPCDVDVSPAVDPTEGFIERTVPPQCVQGEFRWAYPNNTVLLHFPKQEDHDWRTVCVRNDILGNVFTVRDVTHVMGMPMVIGEKESCTFRHKHEITLRIDAPSTLYYVAAIWYRIQIEA